MITDEVSLRVPLMYGWRRETTMRTITQSGVRGEVIYYAPCGKPFRQYPDIMRVSEHVWGSTRRKKRRMLKWKGVRKTGETETGGKGSLRRNRIGGGGG